MRYGRAGGARPLDVDDLAPGFVGDPPAEAAEPPAQVDVLHVHEVALVPAADRVDRGAAQEQHRPRQPVDVAGPVPVDVELAVPAGEAVPRAHPAEQRVPDGVEQGRVRAGRRVLRAVGVAQRGPDRGEVGLGRRAGRAWRPRCRGGPRGRGCRRRRPARGSPRCPRLAAAAYPRLPPGSTTRTSGSARRRASTEPSREPLSTTTISGVPALVSASNDSTHASSNGPAS